jgi:hypothetical protein
MWNLKQQWQAILSFYLSLETIRTRHTKLDMEVGHKYAHRSYETLSYINNYKRDSWRNVWLYLANVI